MIINTDTNINKSYKNSCSLPKKLPVTQPELGRAEGAAPKMVKNTDKPIKDHLTDKHEQTVNQNTIMRN